MWFMETWLLNNIPDSSVDLSSFTAVQADGGPKTSRKRRDLMLPVNNRWCHPGYVMVKAAIYCQDTELLAVSLKLYFVPRVFSHIITTDVYIPSRAASGSGV